MRNLIIIIIIIIIVQPLDETCPLTVLTLVLLMDANEVHSLF